MFPEYGLTPRSPMLRNIQRFVDQVDGYGGQTVGGTVRFSPVPFAQPAPEDYPRIVRAISFCRSNSARRRSISAAESRSMFE